MFVISLRMLIPNDQRSIFVAVRLRLEGKEDFGMEARLVVSENGTFVVLAGWGFGDEVTKR